MDAGFVPWSVPFALGVAAGAWLHASGLPAPAFALALLALPACRPRHLRVWLVLVLALPLGGVRHAQREARPMPLAPLAGRTVELAGYGEGGLLRVRGLGGVRVALRPTDAVPRGPVRVRGRLEAAEGVRNPGGFDERAWLRRRGGAHVLYVDAVTAAGPPATGLREAARHALTRGLTPQRARLMRALVLGEREGAGELRDTFARAGLAHLLALSGLHLGVLGGAAAALLAPLGPWRWAGAGFFAAAFALWVGPTPGLARAAMMAVATGLGMASGTGRLNGFATLALAAGLTLTVRPDWTFDLGFQLSYLSLLGILAWGVPLARRAARGRPAWHPRAWVPAGMAVSASATVATAPMVIDAFGELPPFGPLVNLVAVPLTTVLVPVGFVAAALGAVWAPLAVPAQAVVGPLAVALLGIAQACAALPVITWGQIGTPAMGLWMVGTLPWAWTLRGRLRPWRAAAVTTCALAAACLLALPEQPPTAYVLDVGQGDAIVLRLPGGHDVLVDGGGTPFSDFDVGAEVVVPALRALGVRALDLVVATHADSDHVEGLAAVLQALPVGLLAYGHDVRKPVWDRLLAVADARDVARRPLRRGQRIALGRAELHVLHPVARSSGEPNDDSVVLRVDWRGRAWALLLGDAPAELAARLAIPPVPLLVAAHHGANDGTSAALLRAVRPEVVAISVGRNRYGHPSDAVLARVREVGAEVRRTDQEGALRLSPTW